MPVAAKVSLAVQYMHTAGPVRAMKAEEIRGIAPAEFGLAPPALSVTLFAGPERVLQARFGARNAEDLLQYMTLAGRGRHVPDVALRRPAVGRLDRSRPAAMSTAATDRFVRRLAVAWAPARRVAAVGRCP